jgi:quinol monooxygenase YgiN
MSMTTQTIQDDDTQTLMPSVSSEKQAHDSPDRLIGQRIKHIVMWTLKGDTPDQRAQVAQVVKQQFEGLRGLIPGMELIEIGVNCSVANYACDIVLYSEFDSQQSLDAYATHPEHLRVREALGDLRVERYQVDYPVA